ncbi:hypothetical protein J8273_6632 [Carpediemonas membranifera]|uniref:Uncharacterized protein n=1 Tax=Carpediemonas membranifera TaxID=201153 RepID=A0A8J6AQZ7_9EUKA|nr:hypothetical protein J8273_6632 [Carpediemonas membranifera]|eukprot:KAG9392041.1 hypothetical protein J8273_6632 [Carpediemonas membranifera]
MNEMATYEQITKKKRHTASQKAKDEEIKRRLRHSPLRQRLKAPKPQPESIHSSRKSSPRRKSPRRVPSSAASSTIDRSPRLLEYPRGLDETTRSEMSVNAREATTRVLSNATFQREAIKTRESNRREREQLHDIKDERGRRRRWKSKLEKSPFNVDLVAVHERQLEEQRLQRIHESKQVRQMKKQEDRLHQRLFQRQLDTITSEGSVREEADHLQKERRARALENYLDATSRSARPVTASAEEFRQHHKDLQTLTEQRRKLLELRQGRE